MAVAAFWGGFRIFVFLLACWVLTRWLARERATTPEILLWLPGFAVVLTPAIAVDFARFGPTEPMMVVGLILGLAVVGVGCRRCISRSDRAGRTLGVALILSGYAIYLMGVYSKESSVALLAFIPFFLKWLGPRARARLWESPRTALGLTCVAVLLAAPLLHVGVRLGLALASHKAPYPIGPLDFRSKLYAAAISPLLGFPGLFGTWIWLFLAPAAIAITAVTVRRRHRDAWLLTGVLVTGFLMSASSLMRGPTVSRYYIPWLVAVGAVAVYGLRRTKFGVVAAAAALVMTQAPVGTGDALANWLQSERDGSTAVAWAKGITSAGCPLYLANFDIEQRVAIPLLFRYANGPQMRRCTHDDPEAYALSWTNKPLGIGAAERCSRSWEPLEAYGGVTLLQCASFRGRAIPDQISASGSPNITFVRLRLSKRAPRPGDLYQPPVKSGSG